MTCGDGDLEYAPGALNHILAAHGIPAQAPLSCPLIMQLLPQASAKFASPFVACYMTIEQGIKINADVGVSWSRPSYAATMTYMFELCQATCEGYGVTTLPCRGWDGTMDARAVEDLNFTMIVGDGETPVHSGCGVDFVNRHTNQPDHIACSAQSSQGLAENDKNMISLANVSGYCWTGGEGNHYVADRDYSLVADGVTSPYRCAEKCLATEGCSGIEVWDGAAAYCWLWLGGDCSSVSEPWFTNSRGGDIRTYLQACCRRSAPLVALAPRGRCRQPQGLGHGSSCQWNSPARCSDASPSLAGLPSSCE